MHPTQSLTLLFDFQKIWYSNIDSIGNDIQNLFACPSLGLGGTDLESCLGGSEGAGLVGKILRYISLVSSGKNPIAIFFDLVIVILISRFEVIRCCLIF